VLFIDVENQSTYDGIIQMKKLADFDDASALKILLVDGQVIVTLIPRKTTNTMCHKYRRCIYVYKGSFKVLELAFRGFPTVTLSTESISALEEIGVSKPYF
jgi:hypothetical protein